MPDSTQKVIAIAEETNTFETRAYLEAMQVFYENFIVRTPPGERKQPTYSLINPAYDTMSITGNEFIYNYMWGPSEFSPTGTLLTYENAEALRHIKVPVLFTTGEFDEARPSTVQKFVEMVPGAEFIEVPNAGHGTLADNTEVVVDAHRNFANKVDQAKEYQ